MKRTRNFRYLLAGSIALITFIAYLPALRNEFIEWDDRYYIFKNPFIHTFNSSFLKAAFFDFYKSNWHPLTWISHALDYTIWGLNPFGHHLTNIILHVVNTFLVVFFVISLFEVLKESTTKKGIAEFIDTRTMWMTAGVTGLLFGLHPLHVESVAWVSERKDLLCAFFYLLSMMMYTGWVRSISEETGQKNSLSWLSNKHYLFALGLFILALLSKPMAVTLPVVLLLLDWYPFERIRSLKTFRTAVIEKIPFITLSFISSIVTILAQKSGGAVKSAQVVPLLSRPFVAVQSLVMYLWKMIWPMNLVPFYPYPNGISLFSFKYLALLGLVAAITAACIIMVKKQKIWLAAWGYYVVTLVPVIGIVQVGDQSMADRYTYLPSLGPFLLLGLGAAVLYNAATSLEPARWMTKSAVVAVALGVLLSLSYLTERQIRIWKNSFVFWNYVIDAGSARGPVPYINLGLAYEEKGLIDQALERYLIAVRLAPGDVDAHNDLGAAYQKKGLTDQAIEQYWIALTLNPDGLDAHNNIGVAYQKKGLMDQAIEQYQITLSLAPDDGDAHNNLGVAYEKKGLLDQALDHYKFAVKVDPDNTQFRNNLGSAYEKKGMIALAIEQYLVILRSKPESAPAHAKLGSAYLKNGSIDKAIEHYQAAIRLNPADFDSSTNLGVAYQEKGSIDQAVEQYKIALSLRPGSPLVHNNMGTVYGKLGMTDRAIEHFQMAVKGDPANPNFRRNLTMAYERKKSGR